MDECTPPLASSTHSVIQTASNAVQVEMLRCCEWNKSHGRSLHEKDRE